MSSTVTSGGGLLVPSWAPQRRFWASEIELTLSCASIGVGLVSSFLLAYTILLPLLGCPLLYLELMLGHHARLGQAALTKCLPWARGIEVCMALLVAYVAASLGAVMAQSVQHLLMAFVQLPPRSAGCYGFWEGQVKESCFGPDSRMVCFPGNPTRGCVNVSESTNEHF
ncbi:sodium-dependent noradrenaline transporter-like [Haemaphysalis longicornis]